MEKERDGPRVAPEPTMRSDLEQMPEISDMALEDESDEVVHVPEVRQCRVLRNYREGTGQSISLIGKVPIEILPGKRHIT